MRKNITVEFINERIISNGGLAVVGAILDKSDFIKRCNNMKVDYSHPLYGTLRQRFDLIGSSIRRQILDENIKMLKSNGVVPSKLPYGDVHVDMDISPFDNSKTYKEDVSRTYKGCDGYAPMFTYIGTEGYLANLELCEGKRHC